MSRLLQQSTHFILWKAPLAPKLDCRKLSAFGPEADSTRSDTQQVRNFRGRKKAAHVAVTSAGSIRKWHPNYTRIKKLEQSLSVLHVSIKLRVVHQIETVK